ncbi:hypothetical protein PVAP13_3KG369127 [Panicum virgatum]|uniref:Uncharacterized protein n=1 Tax=Panicum virgatum TaxID=38727 RepID=A0A8T0UQZ2_PANVG|nr:hypothetical protein PVAP13_3KG369127 [Panicum virgatum]
MGTHVRAVHTWRRRIAGAELGAVSSSALLASQSRSSKSTARGQRYDKAATRTRPNCVSIRLKGDENNSFFRQRPEMPARVDCTPFRIGPACLFVSRDARPPPA